MASVSEDPEDLSLDSSAVYSTARKYPKVLYLQLFWGVYRCILLYFTQKYPPENFLYKMGGLKALTSMSFCSERLFFCIFMYFKTD